MTIAVDCDVSKVSKCAKIRNRYNQVVKPQTKQEKRLFIKIILLIAMKGAYGLKTVSTFIPVT